MFQNIDISWSLKKKTFIYSFSYQIKLKKIKRTLKKTHIAFFEPIKD